ncbi:MAG: TonB-dependent receptor [Duganella sp.]
MKMIFTPRLRPLTALLLATGVSTGVHATPADSAAELPTVTVSASKREQALDSINGAAVVVGQPVLDDAGVQSTFDLARVLPGVQMSGSGSLLFPLISVRGVSSAQDFYNPALTVYVDGVPQLAVFAQQSLLDIERVELLKGPQATLYGKSASGGVLNLVTRQPDNSTRLRLRAGVSSRSGHLAEASASGALLTDLLYGALTVYSNNAPGDLHNRATGADHQGGARSGAGKLRLRLAPTGAAWQAGLSASRDCSTASQDAYVPYHDLRTPDAYLMAGMPPALSNFHQRRCGDSAALDARYDLGDWRLSAMAAWQTVDIARAYPIGPYYTSQPEDWRQNVQELRLASQGSLRAWDAVFGLYRQAATQSRDYRNDMVTPMQLTLFDTGSRNHSQSLAAYGDLTWHFTPALDLSAGLRSARDKADTRFAGASLDPATFAPVAFGGNAATSASNTLGKLSAGYRLDGGWRLYANVAQGYKPGGFNLVPSSAADAVAYGRERSTSYETGARYAGAAVQAGLALYQVRSRDAQMYGGDANGYQTLRNVGDTHSSGLEADLALTLAPRWQLNASAYLNHATFRRYNDPAYCPGCTGNDVPFAPPRGASVQLSGELDSPVGPLRPSVSLRYAGAQYFNAANTLRQGGFTVLDATLAWRVRPQLELSLYGRNLADKAYRTYGFSYGALGDFAQVERGRTVGLNATLDF